MPHSPFFSFHNLIAEGWDDYELISACPGAKKERWGKYILVRPDPQVLWQGESVGTPPPPDAVYHRSNKGGGQWEFMNRIPESWEINYGDLRFKVSPTPFKHTGLFPEQAVNWDWMREQVRQHQGTCECLNLFGYSGAATVALAREGARVAHVDASKGMVSWCRENATLSGLSDAPIRYLVDDCQRFVEREIRRGRQYQGILLDPPSFGRGSKGELWKFEEHLPALLADLRKLLAPNPAFLLLNAYTTGVSPVVLAQILREAFGDIPGVAFQAGEILLPFSRPTGNLLPCGIYCRLSFSKN